MKSQLKRYLGSLVFVFLLCLAIAVGATAGVLFVYNSDLPQINSLEDYHPSLVTDVYSDDGQVIGSFALERRIVVTYDQIPQLMKDAIISVEDQNFYSHWGIDIYGIARAALKDIMAGRVVEGGSTLTQQLSKNLFLTPERRFRRKIQEAMLSIQIERYYTKGQILTMYVNQHFMGHGQYGFAAAADFYFNKPLKDLNIEEAALLAALPRSPINYSPILHPDRARMRRDYAIDRMVAEKKITVAQGEEAKSHPIVIAQKPRPDELAPYFVEELRRYLEKKYGTSAVHEGGLKVYSTLNVEAQKAADAAVRAGLREYDKRHGWRGADRNLINEGVEDLESFELPEWKFPLRTNDIVPGIVLDLTKTGATIKIGSQSVSYQAELRPQDIAWTNAKTAGDILKRGDVALFQVRSMNTADRKLEVTLEQKPKAQAAFVAIEPKTGEIKALVGGYDFDESKFDRATQALRQTGSSFKPFVYTAAIDSGLITLDDTIVDSPVSYCSYSPGNYDGKFEGTIGIRRAFADSRNVPAVKILARIGVNNLVPYVRRFGITSRIEPVLPIALGAADVTLIEMVSAYSTFPNDGVRVVPQMIRRVTDYEGNALEENFAELRDVISQETARTMVELMQEPIKPGGTAAKAAELKLPIAGKTGTTNDFTDAWFIGYTPSLAAGAWIGFDEKVTLGDKETGAKAALPIWMDFMRDVYKDKPVEQFELTPKTATATTTTAAAAPATAVSASSPKGAQ
ncbi:MAG TPA: PBP1A family penicillin-binding protein [Terriglobia bacterium]|nr:PBP1A family penicillin-binding protein [Terriglobia bacterium]